MRRIELACLASLALALPLSLAACKRSDKPTPAPPATAPAPAPAPANAPAPVVDPFRVTSLMVGNTIGPDKRVTAPAATLAPTDTIYVSVDSAGKAPSVKLTARWTFEDGQLVSESSETIAPTGPAVTEFHIAKADGWPPGKYKVEILKDGYATGSQAFEVR